VIPKKESECSNLKARVKRVLLSRRFNQPPLYTPPLTMDELSLSMQPTIRDSLDNVRAGFALYRVAPAHCMPPPQLVSARSSIHKRTQALDDLERLFARVLSPAADPTSFDVFIFLQDSFECNSQCRSFAAPAAAV
jgi:hypothetical protein